MKLNSVTQIDRKGMIALSLLAIVACGKNSNSTKSAPVAPVVETTLVSENKSDDRVVLAFGSNVQNASFLCKIDVVDSDNRQSDGQWSTCASSGLNVPLPAGSHVSIAAKAISAEGQEDATPLIKNYSGLPTNSAPKPGPIADGNNNTPVPDPVSENPRIPDPQGGPIPTPGNGYPGQDSWQPLEINSLNLTSSWTFQVPVGMHILQYAANYGIGAGIDVLQIMQGQDPNYFSFYPGNFRSMNGCGRMVSQPVGIRSPAGNVLGYCAGKVQNPGDIAQLFGFEYAPNHIEVGSDANAPTQTRMLVQVYNNYLPGMGILNGLCNGPANVSGFSEVFGAFPVMNDFWAFNYLRDNVKTCRVTLNGLNGGRWQIAGFVFTESEYAANYCQNLHCGGGGSGRALEVLYLERNINGMTQYSDYFVRDFQNLIFNVLGRENPYMPF
jgi:hypothetical protein